MYIKGCATEDYSDVLGAAGYIEEEPLLPVVSYMPPMCDLDYYSIADIIDTYVYRIGIQKADYSFSTAAGMFKSVIALVMILIVNFVAKKTGNEGIW